MMVVVVSLFLRGSGGGVGSSAARATVFSTGSKKVDSGRV